MFLLCCCSLFHHTPPLLLPFRPETHTYMHARTHTRDNMNTYGPLTLPVSQELLSVQLQPSGSSGSAVGIILTKKELAVLSASFPSFNIDTHTHSISDQSISLLLHCPCSVCLSVFVHCLLLSLLSQRFHLVCPTGLHVHVLGRASKWECKIKASL